MVTIMLLEIFTNLNPIYQALIAGLFTWGVTALGSGIVFCFKVVNKNIMDALLGFSGGVMIAASFWSLLSPAIDIADNLDMIAWLVVLCGFISGGLLLFIGDKLFPVVLSKKYNFNLKRCLLLVFSIVLHNIPEGLVIGFSFGAASLGISDISIISAITLAIGIGLQNFPEGSAISLPLRREGISRGKSFFYGQLSGAVEPISAVIGVILVTKIQILLPFLLSFAAGAMIYVVVEELIPESQSNDKKDLMALFTLLGFSVMMVLDVALG